MWNRCRCCALLLWLFAVAAPAHEVVAPGDFDRWPLQRLSEHVYVIGGPQTLPSPATGGFMNNPGFVVTATGVVVVDPGSSRAIGRSLLERIRSVTPLPVVAVLNTHVHGDHWLGNQALAEAFPGVPIFAHRRMIERARAGEAEIWRERLDRMTGGALADTRVVLPGIGLEGGERLRWGGVEIEVRHPGHAHTDHDLLFLVQADDALFLGDLVTHHRVPSSDVPQDANFRGQLEAMAQLVAEPHAVCIPGHGAPGGPEVVRDAHAFLQRLYGLVEHYYEAGLADYEMKAPIEAELAAYRDWHNFGELGRVIGAIYLEVEAERF